METLVRRLVEMVEKHPTATRWGLGAVGGAVTAPLIVAGMPAWLPAGAAGVDNIAWPAVLAPVFVAVMIVYACAEENLARCVAVNGALSTVGAVSALAAFVGWL